MELKDKRDGSKANRLIKEHSENLILWKNGEISNSEYVERTKRIVNDFLKLADAQKESQE